jgi:hypothetical protein
MSEEQMDFFDKMGEKPDNNENELEIRSLAREVLGKITNKESVREKTIEILKKQGKGLENLERICVLVENTLIDDGATDADDWRR